MTKWTEDKMVEFFRNLYLFHDRMWLDGYMKYFKEAESTSFLSREALLGTGTGHEVEVFIFVFNSGTVLKWK